MNNVRTVSDTKRAFYGQHTRPINALYRRVVEELMVEMHLLLVNATFNYDSIYALGVVTVYDRFMTGYEPESDKQSIYKAVIEAVKGDPQQYRRDAEEVLSAAQSVSSVDEFKALLEEAKNGPGAGALQGNLHKVASNPKFKYSRLFVTGMYTVIEAIDPEVLNDKTKRESLLNELAETLGFNSELLIKDIELYRSNLDKMAQAQEVMKDMIEAEKKKKAKREQEKSERAKKQAAEAAKQVAEPTDSPVDSAESETSAE
ncbi:MAG: photosystem II biogenesis protein Psp29 [Phormidesmis sp.]